MRNKKLMQRRLQTLEGILGFEEFRTTPTYHLKMFQKVVLNHMTFQKKLI